MGLGDFLRRAANVADRVSNEVSTAADGVRKSVSTTVNEVKKGISKTVNDISSTSSYFYDSMCEMAVMKVKDIIKDADLQETLDSLDEYEKKSGKDVSALRKFVVRIKEFSEDGDK